MSRRRFDEQQLRAHLTALSRHSRVAFSAACAQRLLPVYESYRVQSNATGANEAAAMLERVWGDLAGSPLSPEDLQILIDRGMAIIPHEDADEWLPGQAAAEDAAAALAYALRCRQNGEAQEAAWAARRVYEALDYFVIERDDIDTNLPGAEDRVLDDPLIQKELDRQQRDIDELLLVGPDQGVYARLRRRAEAEAKSLFGGPEDQ
jgi:uncharacterized protein YjaG (DUF416 family)